MKGKVDFSIYPLSLQCLADATWGSEHDGNLLRMVPRFPGGSPPVLVTGGQDARPTFRNHSEVSKGFPVGFR
jgi:hypothetical protein